MILVTGAAGFIGSVIACELNRRGREDLVLCDKLRNSDKWKNLLGLRFVEFVDRDDLFGALSCAPWASEVDAVIHMGACSDTTERDSDYLVQNNTNFTRTLCRWCLERDARFIYASSAAVYGDGALGFSDDDKLTPRLRPLNAYGFSKWLFDMWVLQNGVADRVVGLRFFNVFGPNEYHKGKMASVVFRSFPMAAKDGKVRLFESHRPDCAHGEQARDFVYVEEAVQAVMFLLDHPEANGIFNVGTGRSHTFNQLATALLEALGKPKNIEYFPMPEEIRDRYQYLTVADMNKLYATGFPPFQDRFVEYVKKYVTQYLAPGLRYYAEVP